MSVTPCGVLRENRIHHVAAEATLKNQCFLCSEGGSGFLIVAYPKRKKKKSNLRFHRTREGLVPVEHKIENRDLVLMGKEAAHDERPRH